MRLPNGYGTVYKLSGNRRRPFVAAVPVGFKENGKVDQKPIGYFAKKPEALQALAEYNEKKKGITATENFKEFKRVQQAKQYTFTDVYNMWAQQRYLDKNKKIPNAYASAFNWCSAIHALPFKDIKQIHMQGVVDACTKGSSTKRNIKTLLNKLSRFALGNDIVQTLYVSLVELPSSKKSDKHKPYTNDEMRAFWAASADKTAQAVLIMSYTGMRPSEFLQIKIKDVYLDERYIRGGLKTAAGKDRVIPIAECIYPFVAEMYNPQNEYLFTSNDKKRVTFHHFYTVLYQNLLQRLKIKKHYPHDGRHTCASALDDAGVSKVIIKKILGHRTNDITDDVYIHKTLPELIEAVNKQAVFN